MRNTHISGLRKKFARQGITITFDGQVQITRPCWTSYP